MSPARLGPWGNETRWVARDPGEGQRALRFAAGEEGGFVAVNLNLRDF